MGTVRSERKVCPRCMAMVCVDSPMHTTYICGRVEYKGGLTAVKSASMTCEFRHAERLKWALDRMLEDFDIPDSLCDEHCGSDYCEQHCGEGGVNCLLHWANENRGTDQACKKVEVVKSNA